MQRVLQIDREQQEEGRDPVEQQCDQQRAAQPRRLDRSRIDQGCAALVSQSGLITPEEPPKRRRRNERQPGPEGPARLTPLDQRHDQRRQRHDRQDRAAKIQLARLRCPRLLQQGKSEQHDQDRHRQVDDEDRPPPQPQEIERNQDAAQRLPDHRGQAEHRAIKAEGERFLRFRENRLHRGERLRGHHRRRHALQCAPGDQRPGRPGEAAQRRGGGKADQAEEEHAAAAIQVAEAPAGDQRHGVERGVSGNDELLGGGRRGQFRPDRGKRDIDDEEIERWQERADQQDREHEPAARFARGDTIPEPDSR